MLFDDNPAASRRRRRGTVTRIAIVSEHASPLAAPGSSACGSQSTYVAKLARELGLAGCLVDIFTRGASPARAPLVHLGSNVRLIHVPAGPAHYVPKEQLLPGPHKPFFPTPGVPMFQQKHHDDGAPTGKAVFGTGAGSGVGAPSSMPTVQPLQEFSWP